MVPAFLTAEVLALGHDVFPDVVEAPLGGEGRDRFEHLDATITLEQGQLCCHPGELRHRGVEITRGRRMLLVGFLQDRRRALFDRGLPKGLQSVLGQEAGRRLRSEWEGHDDAD